MFKKFFIGTLVGGVVYFLMGWVLYGLVMNDVNEMFPGDSKAQFYRVIPKFYETVGAKFVGALVLTWFIINSQYNRIRKTMWRCFLFGTTLNLSQGLIVYSITTMYSWVAIVGDALVYGLASAFAGYAIIAFAGLIDRSYPEK